MATAVRTTSINVPAEKIYAYINEPTNLLEIWPSMVEVKDVEKLPNGGNKFNWVYKMAGMRFDGTSADTEVIPNTRLVSKTEDGIESTITWEVQSENGTTKVVFQAEYKIPIPLVGKFAEAFIIKVNEKEGETVLANLKARMES